MEDRSIGKSNEAIVDFGNDVTCGIEFVAVNDIEELVLDEEDPYHVGPGTIILRFEGREFEFWKCELIAMELIESSVVRCGWGWYHTRTTRCSSFSHVDEAL